MEERTTSAQLRLDRIREASEELSRASSDNASSETMQNATAVERLILRQGDSIMRMTELLRDQVQITNGTVRSHTRMIAEHEVIISGGREVRNKILRVVRWTFGLLGTIAIGLAVAALTKYFHITKP